MIAASDVSLYVSSYLNSDILGERRRFESSVRLICVLLSSAQSTFSWHMNAI